MEVERGGGEVAATVSQNKRPSCKKFAGRSLILTLLGSREKRKPEKYLTAKRDDESGLSSARGVGNLFVEKS